MACNSVDGSVISKQHNITAAITLKGSLNLQPTRRAVISTRLHLHPHRGLLNLQFTNYM